MQPSLVISLAICIATAVSQHVSGIFSEFQAFNTLDLSLSSSALRWLYQLLWQLNSIHVKYADTFNLAMPCVAAADTSRIIVLGTNKTTFASCEFIVAETLALQCTVSKQFQQCMLVSGLLLFDVIPFSNMSCFDRDGWVSVSDGSVTFMSTLNDGPFTDKRADSALARSDKDAFENMTLVKRVDSPFHAVHFAKRLEDWQVLTKSEYYVSKRTVTHKVTSVQVVSTLATTSVQPVTEITNSQVIVTLPPSSTTEPPSPSIKASDDEVIVIETVVVSSIRTQTVVLLSLVSSSSLPDNTAVVSEAAISSKQSLAAEATTLLPSLPTSELPLQVSSENLDNTSSPTSNSSSDVSSFYSSYFSSDSSQSISSTNPTTSYFSSESSQSISSTNPTTSSSSSSKNSQSFTSENPTTALPESSQSVSSAIPTTASSESYQSVSSANTTTASPENYQKVSSANMTTASPDMISNTSVVSTSHTSSEVTSALELFSLTSKIPQASALTTATTSSSTPFLVESPSLWLSGSEASRSSSSHEYPLQLEMNTLFTTVYAPAFHGSDSTSTYGPVSVKEHRGRKMQSSIGDDVSKVLATSQRTGNGTDAKRPDAGGDASTQSGNQKDSRVNGGSSISTETDVPTETSSWFSSSSSKSMRTTYVPKEFDDSAGAPTFDFPAPFLLLIAIVSLSAVWV